LSHFSKVLPFIADPFWTARVVMESSLSGGLFPEDLVLLNDISTRLSAGLSCYPGQDTWTIDLSTRSEESLWLQLQRLLQLRGQLMVTHFPSAVLTVLMTWVMMELVIRGDQRIAMVFDSQGVITELHFYHI
jgi:hypothetical protein